MSILHDPARTSPPVPDGVPHPSWCDPRRCHISLRDPEVDVPLLVHEGEFQKLLYRSIVLFQCESLDADAAEVIQTHAPMVKVEGSPIDDGGFRPDRARVWGELLHDAGVMAERGALPYVRPFFEMGGVW